MTFSNAGIRELEEDQAIGVNRGPRDLPTKVKQGTFGSSLVTTPSWGPRVRYRTGGEEKGRSMEVTLVKGGSEEGWRHLFFYFATEDFQVPR